MSTTIPAAQPGTVAPASRGWAISALILSIVCLIMYVPSLFKWHDQMALMGTLGPFWATLAILDTAITVAFFITSIGVLKGSDTSREMLSYAAAAAIVATLLGFGLSFCMHNDPHFASTMTSTIDASMRSKGQSVPTAQVQQIVSITLASMFYGGLFVGAIQLIYCVLLYRHMSREPEIHTVEPAAPDRAAWPPTPLA
jgi:hypothetical protein